MFFRPRSDPDTPMLPYTVFEKSWGQNQDEHGLEAFDRTTLFLGRLNHEERYHPL